MFLDYFKTKEVDKIDNTDSKRIVKKKTLKSLTYKKSIFKKSDF